MVGHTDTQVEDREQEDEEEAKNLFRGGEAGKGGIQTCSSFSFWRSFADSRSEVLIDELLAPYTLGGGTTQTHVFPEMAEFIIRNESFAVYGSMQCPSCVSDRWERWDGTERGQDEDGGRGRREEGKGHRLPFMYARCGGCTYLREHPLIGGFRSVIRTMLREMPTRAVL